MTRPASDALASLLLDLPTRPADGSWEAEVADRLQLLLSRVPPAARRAFHAAAVGADAASVAVTRRRLRDLDQPERDRLLRALSALPGGTALLEALKVPVLLAAGAARSDRRRTPPQPGPDPLLDLVPASEWPARATADAVVVGSGAGGAMAARTLARAGLSVLVLEEGRHFPTAELAARPPLERFTAAYRDGGATLALGTPPVLLPVGRAVGGTTLVNSGTCYRTPREVLTAWHLRAGVELADPDVFALHLDDVERALRVAPADPAVLGRNGGLALLGAERLGWRAAPLRRNAPGCGGCCECVAGCPTGAKQAVHLSVLPDACRAGATIVTQARVERVLTETGRPGPPRACGVRATRPDGSSFEVLAELVVVAAGATLTPALLRRSGLGAHPRLGRNLAVHPAVSVAGRFDEPVTGPDAGPNVLQSAGVEQWHRDGILIEATAAPPGMASFLPPGLGPELRRRVEEADRFATLGAMIADRPSGRVLGARRPLVRYGLHPADGALLLRAVAAMGRLLLAAGAREVLTGLPCAPVVRSPAGLEEAVRRAAPRSLHLSAFHPTGTVAMGADPQRAPVDTRGMLRGVRGVLVADASLLPTCPRVNPQLTVMAMARAVSGAATAR